MQIRFGDCVIDTEKRQVLRKGGEVVLSPKAYRLLILLMEAPTTGAAGVCEKIRRAVERHPWYQVAPGLQITVSLGYAALTPEMDSPEALVAAADAALYRAKAAGRNCVRGEG